MRVSWLCVALLSVAATLAAARHHPRPHTRHPVVASTPSPSSCELPPGFVHLRSIDPTIIQEMRYGTLHNFMGRVVDMYEAPECILTLEAALALKKVQSFLMSGKADPVTNQSYSLKVGHTAGEVARAVLARANWSEMLIVRACAACSRRCTIATVPRAPWPTSSPGLPISPTR